MKSPAALLAVALALVLGILARPALATGDEAADAPAPVARGSDTPRNAAYTFIVLCRDGQWSDAALMLQEPKTGWPERESSLKLARALKGVLDQRLWLDFDGIPGGEANEPGEPPAVTLGIIESDGLTLDVELVRVDDRWEFSAGTVEGIPAMARTVGVWWVASLPEAFVNLRVAEIELWQWIGLLAIAIAGLLVGWAITATLRTLAARVAAPAVIAVVSVVTPLVFLLSVMGMRFAQPVLVLSAPARASLSGIIRAITVLVIAWMITRWLRVMAVAVEKRLARQGIADGASIVRIGRGVAIALTWMLGAAAALQTFGLDLSAVIAGLGIGTAAIALASQQTLGNLFGGASVIADRVLDVGDTCKFDGTVATVERIGVRSTHLRTSDRTLLIVANGDLAQSRIEKLSARDGFRHVVSLGLRYETAPGTMQAIVAELRTRLKGDPLVDPDSVAVHFLGFGESSLNIDLRATFRTLDMPTYRDAVERLNLDCMRIVDRHGSGFAFPSRTVYMAQDPGVGKR
jgi:MscS family membrane protein